jgi:hypothetical protein
MLKHFDWKIIVLLSTLMGFGNVAARAQALKGQLAQVSNPFCFIQDTSGKVTDLSASVCGINPVKPQSVSPKAAATPTPASNADDTFWQEFSGALSDPRSLQTAELVGQAETTNLAKGVCQTLESGQPLPDPQAQEKSSRYPASYFEAVNTAAVKVYCPKYQSGSKSPKTQ